MSFSSQGNNYEDILTDESSVPDTPMSHLMFYFYCVDKLTNLSENNAQLKRVIDYKNDNLTPNELEVLLVFCTQLDPDSLEGKCLVKNDELCGDKNFKVLKIEDIPEGAVKTEEFFIAGQRVKCDRVIVYKKSWIKTHFYEPWMKVVVPDKQSQKYKDEKEEDNDNNDDDNRVLLPAASPKDNNNNEGGKVVVVEGSKIRVEEGDKVIIPTELPPKEESIIKPSSPSMDEIRPAVIITDNNDDQKPRGRVNSVKIPLLAEDEVENPPLRVKSTPIQPVNTDSSIPTSSTYNPSNIETKPISKHFTIPSNNNNINNKPLIPMYLRPAAAAHTTKVDTNSNDVHIIINQPPQSKEQQKPKKVPPPSNYKNRPKGVFKYNWCGCIEISKGITYCIDCVRNLLTFAVLLVFIALLAMKFINYLDYNSQLLQKYAIIAMFSSLSLSFEFIELCINCCTVKSLNYMGYRLYSLFIAIYYVLISVYTANTDISLPFYCFIVMALIHLFGSCWRVSKEESRF